VGDLEERENVVLGFRRWDRQKERVRGDVSRLWTSRMPLKERVTE